MKFRENKTIANSSVFREGTLMVLDLRGCPNRPCSNQPATETCLKLQIMCVASLGNVTFQGANYIGADETGRIRRLICAFVVRISQSQFSRDEANIII